MTTAVELVTLPQLAERAGLEYRTAHLWVREGVLVPSIKATDGTGHPNYFSEADVDRAAGLVRLRNAGVSFEGLRRLIADPRPLRDALSAWEDSTA